MKTEKRIETAEQFVRRVLAKTFKQRVDADTVRTVAQKVSQAVDVGPKRATESKKAA